MNDFKIEAIKFVLWVQNMDRAIGFYRDGLGLAERQNSPGWSELNWGDAVVALHGGGEGGARETGISLQVSDVQGACGRVREHGAGYSIRHNRGRASRSSWPGCRTPRAMY